MIVVVKIGHMYTCRHIYLCLLYFDTENWIDTNQSDTDYEKYLQKYWLDKLPYLCKTQIIINQYSYTNFSKSVSMWHYFANIEVSIDLKHNN